MAHGATARAGRPAQAQGRGGHGREGAALRQGQRQEDGRGLALGCDPRRDRTARLASAERTRLADHAPEALGRPLGFRAIPPHTARYALGRLRRSRAACWAHSMAGRRRCGDQATGTTILADRPYQNNVVSVWDQTGGLSLGPVSAISRQGFGIGPRRPPPTSASPGSKSTKLRYRGHRGP